MEVLAVAMVGRAHGPFFKNLIQTAKLNDVAPQPCLARHGSRLLGRNLAKRKLPV